MWGFRPPYFFFLMSDFPITMIHTVMFQNIYKGQITYYTHGMVNNIGYLKKLLLWCSTLSNYKHLWNNNGEMYGGPFQ